MCPPPVDIVWGVGGMKDLLYILFRHLLHTVPFFLILSVYVLYSFPYIVGMCTVQFSLYCRYVYCTVFSNRFTVGPELKMKDVPPPCGYSMGCWGYERFTIYTI